MLKRPKDGVNKKTIAIILEDAETTIQDNKTNFEVIGRNGFSMELVFSVTK